MTNYKGMVVGEKIRVGQYPLLHTHEMVHNLPSKEPAFNRKVRVNLFGSDLDFYPSRSGGINFQRGCKNFQGQGAKAAFDTNI